jgi:ankyrin repeat protein
MQRGYTPLYWAAYWGHCDIVALLLEGGASPNLVDKVIWLNNNEDLSV